jgi:GrpB-like predicted nucleotidyltransferase (UPF0157 family)
VPKWFAAIKARIEPKLAGIAHSFEHVGSTAVPEMTAKPVIDIDIVVERGDFAVVKERLAGLGYAYEGDKGLADREAFDLADAEARAALPEHHLYVCIAGAPELNKHLIFRDFMRGHPEWVRKLSEHKVELCRWHANDRAAYIDGKSEMVQQITELARAESGA